MQIVLQPEDFGAVPGTDCTQAFVKMFDALQDTKADAGGGVPVCRTKIQLNEGPYLVAKPLTVSRAGRAQGLTIEGIGKRASEIVKTTAGPLFINQDRWMNVRMSNCSFRSTNVGAQFMYSYSTGAAQDFVFNNVEWRGKWDYGFALDGTNTNSEFGWNNCHINGSYNIAFLYGGYPPIVAQEDQFLNYWYNDCKVEFDFGTFIRMDKGGFIKCNGGSYIIKGVRPDGGISRFFDLPTAGHYDSVCKLAVRDIRFELRHATDQVIRCNWGAGSHVVFDGCSDTALGFQAHSPLLAAHEYTNPGMVSYRDCDLVGQHVLHQPGAIGRQRVTYSNCTHKNNKTAATFFVKDGTNASLIKVVHHDDGDGIA